MSETRSPLEKQLFAFHLGADIGDNVRGIVKVRDKFVIVTDLSVYVAESRRDGHFQIQRIGFIL